MSRATLALCIAGAMIVGIAIGVIVGLGWMSRKVGPAVAGPRPIAEAETGTAANSKRAYAKGELPSGNDGAVSLDSIFDIDTIGVTIAYLENLVGPAKRKDTYGEQVWRVYELGDCEFEVIGDSEVSALRMEFKPGCDFASKNIIWNYSLPAKASALRFDDLDGPITSECITLCGNAADPTIALHWTGSRADRVLEAILEIQVAGLAAIAATDRWEDVMLRAEGEDYVRGGRFNCDQRYTEQGREALKAVPIRAITIGYGLDSLVPGRCSAD